MAGKKINDGLSGLLKKASFAASFVISVKTGIQ
jgi:hypothetical protein